MLSLSEFNDQGRLRCASDDSPVPDEGERLIKLSGVAGVSLGHSIKGGDGLEMLIAGDCGTEVIGAMRSPMTASTVAGRLMMPTDSVPSLKLIE